MACLDNFLLDLWLLGNLRWLNQLLHLVDLFRCENLLWDYSFDNHGLLSCNVLSWNSFDWLENLFLLILSLHWTLSLKVLMLRIIVYIHNTLRHLWRSTHNLFHRRSPREPHLLSKYLFFAVAPFSRRSKRRVILLDVVVFHWVWLFDLFLYVFYISFEFQDLLSFYSKPKSILVLIRTASFLC